MFGWNYPEDWTTPEVGPSPDVGPPDVGPPPDARTCISLLQVVCMLLINTVYIHI